MRCGRLVIKAVFSYYTSTGQPQDFLWLIANETLTDLRVSFSFPAVIIYVTVGAVTVVVVVVRKVVVVVVMAKGAVLFFLCSGQARERKSLRSIIALSLSSCVFVRHRYVYDLLVSVLTQYFFGLCRYVMRESWFLVHVHGLLQVRLPHLSVLE